MTLTPLTPRPSADENPKVAKATLNYQSLLDTIAKTTIPVDLSERINQMTDGLNGFIGPDPEWIKAAKASQSVILKTLEKELKIVSKTHYQNQWMMLGMTAFGLPMGVAFGAALGNMAFLGIGLPIGMALGIAVGTSMDTKAKNEGRQLEWKAV